MKSFLFCSILCTSLRCFSQGFPFQEADSLHNAGKWKEAATAYDAGLKQHPQDGRAWYRLGASYQLAGLYPQAVEAYKKSLQLPPSAIPLSFIRGALVKSYALNRDSTNALNLLQQMVANGYGDFPDLDSAAGYRWMQSNPRFVQLRAKAFSNAYPCLNNPRNRAFDFWIGDWDVYQTGTDHLVGRQHIERASGGCAVLENWTAVGTPGEGKSLNFISPKTGKWEQVWMGSGGASLNYYNGEYRDGAMRYEGDGVNKAGKKLLFHLTFFNLGTDAVRQLLEQSADEGKTWTALYDFRYKRKK